MQRVRRLIRELQRKGFHFSGLLIPALYYFGLKVRLPALGGPWLTQQSALYVLGAITGCYFLLEVLRLANPSVNRFFTRRLRFLMRRAEYRTVTGTGYYLLGSFFSVLLFSPMIAIAAMLFLVFGDFAAAMVGTAIGRVRLFAAKSLEGSLACFVACFVVGLLLFWRVQPDWSVGVRLALSGAAAATLAELLPLRINDNLTIPLLSGLAVLLTAQSLGLFEVPLP
jgi:glycerol-3-phosphate acyltransferase PlsY